MDSSRPLVIHPGEEILGPETPGLSHRLLLDPEGRWAGWTGWIRNDAGNVSGWHQHPGSDTFVYLIRGSLAVDYGRGARDRVVGNPGDFLLIPAGTIHRETTGDESDLEAFVFRVGREPEQVDEAGPSDE